jgi:AraC-like DNA-binding protein
VVKGAARIRTPAETFDLRPGYLCLVDPGVEHTELPADDSRPYTVFWCEIVRTAVFLCHSSYRPSSGWRAEEGLSLTGRTHLQNVAFAIGSELSAKDYGWEQSAQGLLGYLSSLIIRRLRRRMTRQAPASESPAISQDPRVNRILAAAVEFCQANFHRRIRLGEVGAAAGYSRSHVSHLFRAHLGRSVSDYVSELRVNAARELLENTDLPIARIAGAVGYEDPAHFARAFRRAHNLSPRWYRKQARWSEALARDQ